MLRDDPKMLRLLVSAETGSLSVSRRFTNQCSRSARKQCSQFGVVNVSGFFRGIRIVKKEAESGASGAESGRERNGGSQRVHRLT